MSVYYGAKQSTLLMPAVATNSEELFNYAYSMRNEPAMDELYDEILTELRNCTRKAPISPMMNILR